MNKDNGNGYQPDYSVLTTWPVCSWEWPNPIVFVPMPQALPYADEVWPTFNEIARNGVDFIYEPYQFAERARHRAVKQFLDSDFSHIIMLDSDHAHPPDIIQRLMFRVIEDPERLVIGGINFKRSEPYSPCAYVKVGDRVGQAHEWEPGVIEVDSIGFGCVAFAREAFERIEPPWFMNEYSYEHGTLSHDGYFCAKAREAGIKIWCDFTLSSPHMGVHRVTEKTYRSFYQMNPVSEEDQIDLRQDEKTEGT